MHRRILCAVFSVAAAAAGLAIMPTASAGFEECGVVLPAADRLDAAFDLVSVSGTPTYVAGQIRSALAPLHGLRSAAAVDLRLRSDNVASQIDASNPYRPASPERLTVELAKARHQLDLSRASCVP